MNDQRAAGLPSGTDGHRQGRAGTFAEFSHHGDHHGRQQTRSDQAVRDPPRSQVRLSRQGAEYPEYGPHDRVGLPPEPTNPAIDPRSAPPTTHARRCTRADLSEDGRRAVTVIGLSGVIRNVQLLVM